MTHLTVVATLKAKPGCEDKFFAMLQDLIAPTRAEPGCINYDLHRSDEEPGTFLFHETWGSRPLWEAHMQSPHLVAFGKSSGALMESWTLFVASVSAKIEPEKETMKIKFYAHASFRFEANGIAVVTDPYTPAKSGFEPIDEPADLVIMSSRTDDFHSDPSHIQGEPVVVNALELPPEGAVVCGIPIRGFKAYESKTFDYQGELGRDPDANALYHFTLGGLRVLHMGDLGNPVDPAQLDALAGQVDILLALTGEHATIALDDLEEAIGAIRPRVVIPMHYWHERGVLKIEKVDRFLSRFPAGQVTRLEAPDFEITPDTLPPQGEMRIVALRQAR